MTGDDVVYAILLLLSLLVGPVFNHLRVSVKNTRMLVVCMSITGFLMCLVVCRVFIWHSIVTALISAVICTRIPKQQVHIYCFLWSFGYLTFFRTCHFLGFEKPSPHSNAVQLLMNLRLVGLGFEIYDTYVLKKSLSAGDSTETELAYKHQSVTATFTDVLLYAYFYPGILTGPYYKFKTYHDLTSKFSNLRVPVNQVSDFSVLWERLKYAPVLGVLYLFFSNYYFVDYARSDEFLQGCSFLYKVYFMFILFVTFRSRMFFAWIVSECVCMTLGLGGYPVKSKPRCGGGPSDYKYVEDSNDTIDYSTIQGVDLYKTEVAPSVQEGMKGWNMTVQFWLYFFVFRRVPTFLKAWRVSVTMGISAYWHGIHGGYYLSFLAIPPARLAEDSLERLCGRLSLHSYITHFICWFFKFRVFEYLCMGFLLLSPYDTYQCWKATYFYLPITIGVLIALDKLLGSKRAAQKGH